MLRKCREWHFNAVEIASECHCWCEEGSLVVVLRWRKTKHFFWYKLISPRSGSRRIWILYRRPPITNHSWTGIKISPRRNTRYSQPRPWRSKSSNISSHSVCVKGPNRLNRIFIVYSTTYLRVSCDFRLLRRSNCNLKTTTTISSMKILE